MDRKPVIGIILDLQENNEKNLYSFFPWYALRKNYSDSISIAGGIPIFLPHEQSLIKDTLQMIDGLLIPGGDFDIDPEIYGQKIMSSKVSINKQRSAFEMLVIKSALELEIPILGICNGMQLINVIYGGTLIQDILELRPNSINHEQPHPKNIPFHGISIVEKTRLHTICNGKTNAKVTSTHHQAVDKLGDRLLVSARAEDGIIEAIELDDPERFVVGVEWHPEYLSTKGVDLNLFKEFIQAASKYKTIKKS